MPPGETSFRAIVLAISVADSENVPRGGWVESVLTVRTHFRFETVRFLGVFLLTDTMRARRVSGCVIPVVSSSDAHVPLGLTATRLR